MVGARGTLAIRRPMTASRWRLGWRSVIGLGLARTATMAVAQAQTLQVVKPRLSHTLGRFFQNNPAACNQFMSQLPWRRLAQPVLHTSETVLSASEATIG